MALKINKLMLSVAGSGKTTYLVKEALKIKEQSILITTFTEANQAEIKSKFYKMNGSIPINVTIQTWFSFLLQHGIRPYQGAVFDKVVKGMLLVNSRSGLSQRRNILGNQIPYSEEKEFDKHYFSNGDKIYSDKLSKLVVKCNKNSKGLVIKRIGKIFQHIFIDEVQDLAGHDLELIILFFKAKIRTTLVGDPRQVTYLTHHERKHSAYKEGNIKQFIFDKAAKFCDVDEVTLRSSHRNSLPICDFSSKLYPNLIKSEPCVCTQCREVLVEHIGVYIIREEDVELYKAKYSPTVLRHNLAVYPEWNYGACKGLGFDRVLIYPTKGIIRYLIDGELVNKTVNQKTGVEEISKRFDIAKFYVALTRARHSVAIIYNYTDETFIAGLDKWNGT